MAKLWVPSTIVLVCALVLSFLVSLSLPWLSALDISRVAITDDRVGDIVPWLSKDIRFGVWTACSWDFDDKKECVPRGTGYTAPIGAFENVEEKDFEIVTLTPGWTRGLAIHPVVTGVIGLALGASLSTRHTVNLFAPLICVLAAAITLIAFAIDIALHLRIRSLINRFDIPDGAPIKIAPGPGFWITLVVLVLNAVAAAILFIARRRELKGDSAYPMLSTQYQSKGFFSRFKK